MLWAGKGEGLGAFPESCLGTEGQWQQVKGWLGSQTRWLLGVFNNSLPSERGTDLFPVGAEAGPGNAGAVSGVGMQVRECSPSWDVPGTGQDFPSAPGLQIPPFPCCPQWALSVCVLGTIPRA